jgi:hypothetical protein
MKPSSRFVSARPQLSRFSDAAPLATRRTI